MADVNVLHTPSSIKRDLTGQHFGRLIVLGWVGKKSRMSLWACQCKCGNTTVVRQCHLVCKHTTSCGCFNHDKITVHGKHKTSTYRVWDGIKQRCFNPKASRYDRYGGRGITICKRWMKFENFLSDMGERPVGTSINRINNDGHYEPGNCEWTSAKAQQNNNSRNHLVEFHGERLTITQWAERTGIDKRTLLARLRLGWSVQRALTKAIGTDQSP